MREEFNFEEKNKELVEIINGIYNFLLTLQNHPVDDDKIHLICKMIESGLKEISNKETK